MVFALDIISERILRQVDHELGDPAVDLFLENGRNWIISLFLACF